VTVDSHQPKLYNGKPLPPNLAEKQLKEFSKQRELLLKLQREKQQIEE